MNRVLFNIGFVVLLGSFLHFAWQLSGRNSFVAIFAAVNESTWEHLKMAFWPALLLVPVHRALYKREPGSLPSAAARTLLPPTLIVVFFYSYLAVLGHNELLLDIGIFILAIFIGEAAGEWLVHRHASRSGRVGAAVLIGVAAVAFATLSFNPPRNFLFEEPKPRQHGA